MTDCLFCTFAAGPMPPRVFEDDRCLAIADINPQAPTHLLVIPRVHVATLNDLTREHEPLIGHLVGVAAKLMRDQGHAEAGWRTLFNVNRDAGQTVFHLHLHVLGGRQFGWPPG